MTDTDTELELTEEAVKARAMTEKGLEYTKNLKEKQIKSVAARWKKTALAARRDLKEQKTDVYEERIEKIESELLALDKAYEEVKPFMNESEITKLDAIRMKVKEDSNTLLDELKKFERTSLLDDLQSIISTEEDNESADLNDAERISSDTDPKKREDHGMQPMESRGLQKENLAQTEQMEIDTTAFCHQCGRRKDSNARFCRACGTCLTEIVPCSSASPQKIQAKSSNQNMSHDLNKPKNPTEMTEVLRNLTLLRTPLPEPNIFDGDPLKYLEWKTAFDTLIHHQGISDNEAMHYLKRYLSGTARESVEGYFLFSSSDSYKSARELLETRFGGSFAIATAFRNKLEHWPKIGSKDGIALRRYADFLHQCRSAMLMIDHLDILNDERENAKMVSKLPDWVTRRWQRIVYEHRATHQTFPEFASFQEFVDKESNIACDPLTTSLSSNKSKVDASTSSTGKRNTFQTTVKTVTPQDESSSQNDDPEKDDLCHICEKPGHKPEVCRTFKKMSMDDRKKAIMNKGLCFGCLKRGHRSKDCRKKLTCETCKGRHPTPLHEDRETSKEPKSTDIPTANSLASCAGDKTQTALIMPVLVSSGNNNEQIFTYAMLDTQSDTTFVSEKVADQLRTSSRDKTLLRVSTLLQNQQPLKSKKFKDLRIRGANQEMEIQLPTTFELDVVPGNKNHIPGPETARRWPHLKNIARQMTPVPKDADIGMLIGYDCIQAITPREVINGPGLNDAFAMRTDLGWAVVGHNPDAHNEVLTFKTSTKEISSPEQLMTMIEIDFVERKSDSPEKMSQEDFKFMEIMKKGIRRLDSGKFELPLPLKADPPGLCNNRVIALRRLDGLKRRFLKDENYRRDYHACLGGMIAQGYAEKIPKEEIESNPQRTWYIPHHGVYHPNKPSKLRVVFDCSATFKGKSLNDCLLKGPDLTNTLIGVLCRFRLEPVAFSCDIRQMFHQFSVYPEDRNLLRFLWWDSNDCSTPSEYRMKVHLFGATSSPACANYGLKQCGLAGNSEGSSEASDFLRNDFYVDDGLKSTPTEEDAIKLIDDARRLCKNAGLLLHKFLSNSHKIMNHIPLEDRANLGETGQVPQPQLIEKALGVQWCISDDSFRFRITLQDTPLTRRGIMSTLYSIYDPLGLIAPVVLAGKIILQDLCRSKADWDSPVDDETRARWEAWRYELPLLLDLRIERCLKPKNFQNCQVEVHHFSDASSSAYGQCSYIRHIDQSGKVHCSFLIGKARVAPLKSHSIPRLELTAATVSARMSRFLQAELRIPYNEFFWTDSQIVLGYISNDSKRFHVYVANRVSTIQQSSSSAQWKHVSSTDNPADEASRGLSASQFLRESKWLFGPDILWKPGPVVTDRNIRVLDGHDPEIKGSSRVNVVSSSRTQTLDFSAHSDWNRLVRCIARCKRLARRNKNQVEPKTSTEEIQAAEISILKVTQKDLLDMKAPAILKQNPFKDKDGIVRAGGRLRNSDLPYEERHPIILPAVKSCHVSLLILRYCHERVAHQGRGMTINEVRASGFLIIGCSAAVASLIHSCVTCKKLRAKNENQRMADLPVDRTSTEPPFTYVGADYFGPFLVKQGRKEVKRYGVVFTCLSSRAVHVEVADSLTSDGFIMAWRRLVAIRGPVKQIRSDQGTNFVGARGELQKALKEMDVSAINATLAQNRCDFVDFTMNVPHASHMGGVWERMIRSIRSILTGLLTNHGNRLTDESLRTLLYEAAAIVNNRPLTVDTLNDPDSLRPLTPNHLLTMKTRAWLAPPGKFGQQDLYLRAHWKKVQHLSNMFWSRWKREYLQSLQQRQKWTQPKKNLKPDDIVLLTDDSPRNTWRMARILEVNASADGLVRSAKIRTTQPDNCTHSTLNRPIHKLILLYSP